jgi:hypothetical protein
MSTGEYMRLHELLTEATIDLEEQVDYLYDKFFKDENMEPDLHIIQTLEQYNFEHYLQQTNDEFNDEWLEQMTQGLLPELQ